MLLEKFSFKCHWVLYFSVVLSVWLWQDGHDTLLKCVLSDIRLGGLSSQGFLSNLGLPHMRNFAPKQADSHVLSVSVTWRVKFNREELKGKANPLPQPVGDGSPVSPLSVLGQEEIGWILFGKPPPLVLMSLWMSFLSQF